MLAFTEPILVNEGSREIKEFRKFEISMVEDFDRFYMAINYSLLIPY